MQLIGMLDSPYVRRVAISLEILGLPFEHRSVSVFSTFSEFQAINPVVKAPTLVCDDGEVLMESTLILDYAETLAQPRTLLPTAVKERQHALRVIGLALASCEKAVQIVYERNLRPAEKQHEPWVTRVRGQLLAALGGLQNEIARLPPTLTAAGDTQAGVATAVAWNFIQQMIPEIVSTSDYPSLVAHSGAAEALPAFVRFPHDGPGVPRM
jgi:glutathione S-transferase